MTAFVMGMRPFWGILSRLLAALLGGYAVAFFSVALLSYLLPLPRADAVLLASLPGFAVEVGAVLWAFAAKSARIAWGGIDIALVLLGGITLILRALS